MSGQILKMKTPAYKSVSNVICETCDNRIVGIIIERSHRNMSEPVMDVTINPLSKAIGAEILGVDLSEKVNRKTSFISI